MKYGILGLVIRNKAQGIRNSTNDWNPESKLYWQILESSTCGPESTAWNQESKTSCLGFLYMGRTNTTLQYGGCSCLQVRWQYGIVMKPVRPRPLFILLRNERCIIILIHLTDNKNNKNVALVCSVTTCESKKKGIVHGQGAPKIMSFLILLSWLVSSNNNGHMFLGLLRVIFL